MDIPTALDHKIQDIAEHEDSFRQLKKDKEKCGDCAEYESCETVCEWFKWAQLTWFLIEHNL